MLLGEDNNKGVNWGISLLISDKDKCFEENKMRGGAQHCIKVVQEDLKESILSEFRLTGSCARFCRGNFQDRSSCKIE